MSERLPTGRFAKYLEIIDKSLLSAHDKVTGSFPRSQVERSVSAIAGAQADLTVITPADRTLLPPSWAQTYLTLHVSRDGENGYPLATAALIHRGAVVVGQTVDHEGIMTRYDPSERNVSGLAESDPRFSLGVLTSIGDVASAAVEASGIISTDMLVTGVDTSHQLLAGVACGEFKAGMSIYPPTQGDGRVSTFAAIAPWYAAMKYLGYEVRSAGNMTDHDPWDLTFVVARPDYIDEVGRVAGSIINGH